MRKPIAIFAGVLGVLVVAGCNIKSPDFSPQLTELRVCEANNDGSCPANGSCSGRPAGNPSIVAIGQDDRKLCASGFYSGLSSPDDNLLIEPEWRDLSNDVAWSVESAGSGSLRVGASGELTPVSPSARALQTFAKLDGIEGSTFVRVSEPVLENVVVQGIGNIGAVQPNGTVVVLEGTSRAFNCIAQYSGDKGCTGGASCVVTDAADWTSSSAAHSINNSSAKGTGRAEAAGEATINCMFDTLQSNPGVRLQVCPLSELTGIRAEPQSVDSLPLGSTVQLSLIATFTNCLGGNEIEVDVSRDAQWSSNNDLVATVGPDGLVTSVGAGTAVISGQFADQDPVTISVDVVNVEPEFRIGIDGPVYLISGVDSAARYTAQAFFVDPDTGEEIPTDITDSEDTIWSSSASDVLGFPVPTNGDAVLAPDALPQTVAVRIAHKGVSATLNVVIVGASLRSVEVTPDVVCSGGTLNTGVFVEYPFQLTAHAIIEPQDADGNPLLTDTNGDALSCSVNATESATWTVTEGPLLPLDLGGLPIPVLGDLLGALSDCEFVPGTLGDSFEDAPVVVTDVSPKGQVSPNPNFSFLLAGTACVQAGIGDIGAASTFIVVTDPVELVCDQLLATNTPSQQSCSAALSAK